MPFVAVRSYSSMLGKSRTFSRPKATATRTGPPVVRAGERNASAMAKAFQQMVETVKSQIPLSALEAALEKTPSAIMNVLDVENRMLKASQGAGIPPKAISFYDAVQRTFRDGAQAEMESLQRVRVQKANVGTSMTFDLLNPEAVRWITTYSFNLIREVSTETRMAVQEVVNQAFRQGGHPRTQARAIRNFIGLTRRQIQAVENFRRLLESGNPQLMEEALGRALRDKRFDSTVMRTIQQRAKLPQKQIDTMVERYYERALKHRAETIAISETLRASHAGQQEIWRQAREQGLLRSETKRRWIVAAGACDICVEIPKLNLNGVGLEEPFRTPDGAIQSPPVHPRCKCSVVLKFD